MGDFRNAVEIFEGVDFLFTRSIDRAGLSGRVVVDGDFHCAVIAVLIGDGTSLTIVGPCCVALAGFVDDAGKKVGVVWVIVNVGFNCGYSAGIPTQKRHRGE